MIRTPARTLMGLCGTGLWLMACAGAGGSPPAATARLGNASASGAKGAAPLPEVIFVEPPPVRETQNIPPAMPLAEPKPEPEPEPQVQAERPGRSPTEAPSDVGTPPRDAKRTKSGLAFKVLRRGKGSTRPRQTDEVLVHYAGWGGDGSLFDSSYQRGQPATLPVSAVIKGWNEGLKRMVEGDRVRLWIPPDLAYGHQPRAGVPQGTLTFDVELLEIVRVTKSRP